MVLLLGAVLSVETLSVSQIHRGLSRGPVQQPVPEVPIDLGQVFQSW
jgi:hypothetical protein